MEGTDVAVIVQVPTSSQPSLCAFAFFIVLPVAVL